MRDRYIMAKALAIAVAVLNCERPYRQGSDIKDMNKLLKATGFWEVAGGIFERELEMVEQAKEKLELESARAWANGPKHRKRVIPLFKAYPDPEEG